MVSHPPGGYDSESLWPVRTGTTEHNLYPHLNTMSSLFSSTRSPKYTVRISYNKVFGPDYASRTTDNCCNFSLNYRNQCTQELHALRWNYSAIDHSFSSPGLYVSSDRNTIIDDPEQSMHLLFMGRLANKYCDMPQDVAYGPLPAGFHDTLFQNIPGLRLRSRP